MACMKMLGLAILASAKGVDPTSEKHRADTPLRVKSGRSAKAKEEKCLR
jgi:hypothetical protein